MNLNAVKSELADIAQTALDTVDGSIHDGRGAFTHATHAVGRDLSRVVARVANGSSPADTLRTLGSASVVAAVGALAAVISPEMTVRGALRALGLQRRPSTLARVATGTGLIVAGAAVGAGVAMLMSPRSGKETRALLVRDVQSVRHEAVASIEAIGTQLQGVVHGEGMAMLPAAHNAEDPAHTSIRGSLRADGAAKTPDGKSHTRVT